MALYAYQALTKSGKKETGQLDAPSVSNVQEQLLRQGLYPVSIVLATGTSLGIPWYRRLFERAAGPQEVILFTKQLAVLLKSGVPLLQSMELLIEQFDGAMRSMLVSIKDGVKEGKSLADGLSRYPKVFDSIYVQLVRAGEATGRLEKILERLTVFLERRMAVSKKVRKALSGPLTQLFFIAAITLFLLTYVVPQLAQTFAQGGKQLPLSTRLVMGISDAIRGHYILLLSVLVCLIAGFLYWRSTPSGAKTLDRIKIKLPLINYFTKTAVVVQFSRTLGMLLEGGVNLSQALDIVCRIVNNRVLADELMAARDNIIRQGKIAQYLKKTDIFPPVAIYLISTGEQSGNLDEMLLTVADNYEVELAELTDSLAQKIDPIMMGVMAVVVGTVVMAIAQPLLQMSQLVG